MARNEMVKLAHGGISDKLTARFEAFYCFRLLYHGDY